jgi:hypothetical protein
VPGGEGLMEILIAALVGALIFVFGVLVANAGDGP